jgi:acrylyl-CoA reductase (NADPH)
MNSFSAYRIFDEAGKSEGRFVEMRIEDLDPGDVVIQAQYSSLNYKDALAATGAGKVIRRFPCVGGIDVAGVVKESSDGRFKPGDSVVVTGYDMGVAHDGGFAEYVRVPADWVVPLPSGMTNLEAMSIGTAGFTAALSIHRMELNGFSPERGKVVVTGATGGVSSLGIQMLSQRGYHVVAITGKEGEHEYLESLGAREVLSRKDLVMGTRPLEKAIWSGALDSVGGETLAWLTRTMQQNGVIASFGNAGGIDLHTTVLPFILRGVQLIGIDSAATAMPLRRQIWQRLAGDLRPSKLSQMTEIVSFKEFPEIFPLMLQGRIRGRRVVEIKHAG